MYTEATHKNCEVIYKYVKSWLLFSNSLWNYTSMTSCGTSAEQKAPIYQSTTRYQNSFSLLKGYHNLTKLFKPLPVV